jgi:putative membrane protein
MMHHWDGGWSAADWLLMGFGMLLFWALVVAGIIWAVHYAGNRPAAAGHGVPLDKPTSPAGPARPSAQEILDERYARGEISDEEYRTRRDNLTSR